MTPRALARSATFWIGILTFLAAAGLLVRSQLGAGSSGWGDLAAFAGALVLSMAAGVAFGVFLWLADVRTASWRLMVARVGAGISLLVAPSVGFVALRSSQQWLLVGVALVAIVASAGIVASSRVRAARSV